MSLDVHLSEGVRSWGFVVAAQDRMMLLSGRRVACLAFEGIPSQKVSSRKMLRWVRGEVSSLLLRQSIFDMLLHPSDPRSDRVGCLRPFRDSLCLSNGTCHTNMQKAGYHRDICLCSSEIGRRMSQRQEPQIDTLHHYKHRRLKQMRRD